VRPQIIVDCETTSLTPDYDTGRGVIWEVALIERDCGAERLYRMEPDLNVADPVALRVGRYRERTSRMFWAVLGSHPLSAGCEVYDLAFDPDRQHWSEPQQLADILAHVLQDATLIAANPTFDAGFLGAFLAVHGYDAPPWHYRLRDIESMTLGWLHGRRFRHPLVQSPGMDEGVAGLARFIGLQPERFDLHTALGDVRLVAAMLQVIEGNG
jgi:hypothetical protein